MNLALTYASRTQHVRLARHISELIQQKSMEELSDDDDLIGQFDNNWANQDAGDDTTDDVMYAKSRSHTLNKRSDLVSKMSSKKINLSSKFGKMTSSSTDGRSKFNRYMDQVKRGKFLSSASNSGRELKVSKGDQDGLDEEDRGFEEEHGNSPGANGGGVSSTGVGDLIGGLGGGVGEGGGYDETKELFSDSEQDPAGDGGMEVEGERGGGGGGESDDGLDDDFSFTPTGDGGGFSASSGKRANPFKVGLNSISYITLQFLRLVCCQNNIMHLFSLSVFYTIILCLR